MFKTASLSALLVLGGASAASADIMETIKPRGYDRTFMQGKLLDETWSADYHMPLPGIRDALDGGARNAGRAY